MPAELDGENLWTQLEERLTRAGDFYGIPFVLNDNIRLSGRSDSHAMICGHPDNVERPLLEHAGEFACAFADGQGVARFLPLDWKRRIVDQKRSQTAGEQATDW